jgi:histone H1/5
LSVLPQTSALSPWVAYNTDCTHEILHTHTTCRFAFTREDTEKTKTKMADVTTPTPAKATPAKAPKKKTTAKVVKKPAAHPKYSEMVSAAIAGLKERGGSSRQAILKYIIANYKVGSAADAKMINSRVKVALRAGVKSAALKQAKGTGASGSFRLGEKPKAPKKAKKPAAAKPKKAKSPKKAKKPAAAAKKAKSPKKVKKAAKAAPAAKKVAVAAKPKKVKTPKKAAAAKPKAAKPKKVKTPKKAAAKPKK